MNEESVKRRLEMLLVDLEVYKDDKAQFEKTKTRFLDICQYYMNSYDLSEYIEKLNKKI